METQPGVENKRPLLHKILGSSVFWWLFLTFLYTLIYNINYNGGYEFRNKAGLITQVGQFIGLFVPIGPQNLIFVFFWGIPLLMLAVGLGSFEYIAHRDKFSLKARIIGSLLMLFLITFIMDIVFTGKWCSILILIEKNYYAC